MMYLAWGIQGVAIALLAEAFGIKTFSWRWWCFILSLNALWSMR